MKKLRKELSDLKSGINNLYHTANHTHTADSLVSPPSPSPSPSPSAFNSSLGSNDCNNNSSIESVYDNTDTLSSVFSTPKVNHKPLPASLPPKSFASAVKTNVTSTKSPKEIICDRTATSCTNKGMPSNVLVLSDFKAANTAESYKRIAEMRKNINDTLVENKCKSISWSSRGNLVTKCARPLSTRDKTDIINSAKATFGNDPIVLNKNTVSYVKFIDVPSTSKAPLSIITISTS
ncbi:hypothetical protein M378DRAFT_19260 [Amanita muscaria Koide BX008]|uniref:Uncharacterized protein n=1 Tax=Amanita muscaria (strain Koide BX008) TaxID=946122 RepID=A0A0C2WDE9_AMAMK|nr:hypothetical protein M378DRAFT_19260 [Amanita muscaria Koide BX008]